ncbi:class I SAM-dependent methyltransferase [Halalkalibacterium halodurans]|uniref:class I SAM-dependent methyltransferase n=1 Tax=Halalkalibacterium halodurans TaxID=86665 RepID=UPI000318AEE8|nr:class I SAM-dependent methyltransferase [Halalkalibacterium halodurans]MED4082329.1 class I SAM-dependent methyltransferase [Halalkalibacterium halodurans]MED4083520.1 class I SAM-dependent methyltransferase [Halalkalibacterium halodurans]MED4105833.1 class I SAM-dependent methyltransferase [Halalkalibacterium halodurans]MED4109945.1 class I SAM-dependent methyltransferase [Halalkalibacterium halodurans]MED4149286.1 class I SAM-dependent methyltransferase [Halalkalibacterium halodurans]
MIDFHDKRYQYNYATRRADVSWIKKMSILLDSPTGHAVDIGCGGGIYTRALTSLGFDTVTGVDSSLPILEVAKQLHPTLPFHHGQAEATGLASGHYSLVYCRALIHHLNEVEPFLSEAFRLLENDGQLIVQDRTSEDCFLQGSPSHIRGYYYNLFPHLQEIERKRRPTIQMLSSTIIRSGYEVERVETFWETRQTSSKQHFLQEIRARTGRSILHALSDHELNKLIAYLDQQIQDEFIEETDRWTIWVARK